MAAMTLTSVNEYIDRVAEIEPVLRDHADANERERRLVEPVVSALREAGLYRIGVPRHYGGSQLDPVEACRIVTALAEIDSAPAWNVGIAAVTANFFGLFDESVTDLVFGDDPDTVCASSIAAPAFVTSGGEDLVVNGELRFLSGADQAKWFMSVALRLEDGQPVMDASGASPLLHVACVERTAVNILDRWHVSAMRGTGSTDVALNGVRVPASQVKAVEHLRPSGHFSDPEFQIFPWNGPHLEAAVSIGIARAALRDLTGLAATKIAADPKMMPIKNRERVQHNLALATALVDAAQAYAKGSLTAALEHAAAVGGALTTGLKSGLQLSAFMAADSSARAVDLVCEAAGTSSGRLEHRFERYHRDVHFLTKHADKSVERVTDVGKMLLGMPTGWMPLDQ